jgi:hypothetical protein
MPLWSVMIAWLGFVNQSFLYRASVAVGAVAVMTATVIHLGWSLMLCVSALPLRATPLNIYEKLILSTLRGFARILVAVGLDTSWMQQHQQVIEGLVVRSLIVVMLAAASFAALVGLNLPGHRLSFVLLLPQQVLLFCSAVGGAIAAWLGMYADGTVIDGRHILADQWPVIVLAVMYAPAVILWHLYRR